MSERFKAVPASEVPPRAEARWFITEETARSHARRMNEGILTMKFYWSTKSDPPGCEWAVIDTEKP